MNLLSASLWITLAGVASPRAGDAIPPGLHPTGVLLLAFQEVDGHPLTVASEDLGARPVRLAVSLTLHEASPVALRAVLRSAGVHLHRITTSAAPSSWFATGDPGRPPGTPLPYRVKVIPLRHIDAVEAARLVREAPAPEGRGKEAAGPPLHVVADRRGGALVVRYSSEEALAWCLEIVARVDVPPREGRVRPILRTWTPQRWRVDLLAEELRRRWRRLSDTELHVVPHLDTNTLLIRLPRQRWEAVRELLEEIDKE
ncbi:MAG: secretin N-terminal domain-containing protein [Planctomycetota bacterium]